MISRESAAREAKVARPADRRRSYEIVAPFYEELARMLSLGRIGAAKRSQLDAFAPGTRVLYAGVGSGEDAEQAVRFGLDVVALDLSPRMLARLRGRLGDRAGDVRFHCEDFLAHRGGPYDALALNFFLNVFDAFEVERVLDHALALLGPSGGRIAIADFAPPRNALERAANPHVHGLGRARVCGENRRTQIPDRRLVLLR